MQWTPKSYQSLKYFMPPRWSCSSAVAVSSSCNVGVLHSWPVFQSVTSMFLGRQEFFDYMDLCHEIAPHSADSTLGRLSWPEVDACFQ